MSMGRGAGSAWRERGHRFGLVRCTADEPGQFIRTTRLQLGRERVHPDSTRRQLVRGVESVVHRAGQVDRQGIGVQRPPRVPPGDSTDRSANGARRSGGAPDLDAPARSLAMTPPLPAVGIPPRRAVALYLATWIPVLGLFFATQRLSGTPALDAAAVALGNVLPAAALGYGACLVTHVVRWPRRWRDAVPFVATHVAFGAAYGFLWTGAARWTTRLLTEGTAQIGSPQFDGWWWWGIVLGGLLYNGVVSSSYAYRTGLDAAARVRDLRESEAALDRAEAARAQAETAQAQAETAQAQAEAARTSAELAALRAHLHPHFFFNTLHALSALVREDPRQAQQAVEWFGDLFHYTLRNDREGRTLVRLSEELDFARTYLDLEALRLGDRLRLAWDVDEDALDALVPPLLVQPLVENAVRHGIAPRREGGTLSVGVWVAEGSDGSDVLEVEVADDGAGVCPVESADGPGYGLRGLRRTLAHLYGPAAALTVRTRPGAGFVARLHLPLALQLARAPSLSLSRVAAPAA